jgi:hypothetical protein
MAAEHDDDGALAACRLGYGVGDGEKIARHQNVGQRAEEGGERTVVAGWGGELFGADLVRPARDRDGADAGEIGLAGARMLYCVVDAACTTGAGRYDLR